MLEGWGLNDNLIIGVVVSSVLLLQDEFFWKTNKKEQTVSVTTLKKPPALHGNTTAHWEPQDSKLSQRDKTVGPLCNPAIWCLSHSITQNQFLQWWNKYWDFLFYFTKSSYNCYFLKYQCINWKCDNVTDFAHMNLQRIFTLCCFSELYSEFQLIV